MQINKYRPDIDAIRAIAILLVIIFHFDDSFFSGGFIGVDIFFVISGFVITNNILAEISERQKFSLINFYQRRIKRLFPALFVMINLVLIYVISSNYLLLETAKEKLIDSAIYAASGLANIFFIKESRNYFVGGSESELLLHTWSLSIEEQFYLVFAFFLIFKIVRKNFTIFFVFLAVLSFVFSIICFLKYPLEGFYLPFSRAYEFIIGILIARFHFEKKLNFLKDKLICHRLAIIGLLLISLSALYFSKATTMPSFYALFPCLGAAFLILAGFNKEVFTHKILNSKYLVFVGKISYSLYLYHLPILVLSVGLINPIWQIFLIIFFALFSYYLVENIFRNHQFFSKTKIVYGFLALNLAVLVLIKFNSGFLEFNKSSTKYILNSGFPKIGDCFFEYEEKISEKRIGDCLKYDPKKKNILLFGDSHAAAFSKTFDDAAKNHDFNVMRALSSLCAPIFDLKNINYKALRREFCPFNKSYLRQKIINKEIKIDVVFLAARWNFYGFYLKDRFEDLQKTINFFKENNIKIFILAEVPIFLENIGSRNVKTKFVSSRIIDDYYLKINKKMEKFLAAQEEISYYFPFKDFCQNSICRVINEKNEILYIDYDHLSYHGANMIFKKIEPEFLRLINK
jgi:peptidoglycan/LPS O-acetylase OafA/YrhL